MDFNFVFEPDRWAIRVSYDHWSFRITPVRAFLIALIAAAGCIMLYRFAFGLESVSSLSDRWPWGLWKGWAVFAGAALAGGGYFTTCLVHVFHIERLKPICHRTLLISLLGYTLLLIGLFVEIGRWFNFWRPFVSWGHESPLFEVFWCVSLYTIIQFLELTEIMTQKVLRKFHWILVRIFPVLAIVGVVLPSMHQSSLGAIYLMMEGRLDPLWWSPYIFLFYLLSSLYVGPAMLAVESVIVSKAFGHVTPMEPLKLLARIGGVLMLIYLVLKIADLVAANELGLLLANSYESNIFIAEMVFGVIIPLAIVFSPLINSRPCLIAYGFLASGGVFLNRMNVSITGMARDAGVFYFPSLFEFIVMFGIVAGVVLVYLFMCENFNILTTEEEHE
ncbi:MAG: hypothetical protein LBU65_04505 [Planctomycetaceae bacterium]|jgi:Ni/Fe-hydrogenase subunit HybB-like protein|nr:hypothetical protein [Planctomycetaceae bacterium]